jgi:hypothetical protein
MKVLRANARSGDWWCRAVPRSMKANIKER